MNLSVRRVESEEYKSWDMSVGGFGHHVSTDDPLFVVLFVRCARQVECVWRVRLSSWEHGKKMSTIHGLDAELGVQRTTLKTKLTIVVCAAAEVFIHLQPTNPPPTKMFTNDMNSERDGHK